MFRSRNRRRGARRTPVTNRADRSPTRRTRGARRTPVIGRATARTAASRRVARKKAGITLPKRSEAQQKNLFDALKRAKKKSATIQKAGSGLKPTARRSRAKRATRNITTRPVRRATRNITTKKTG